MKRMPDGAIDMILCDPPYGTTDCEWDQVIPFDQLWEQYRRIIKDNGAIVLFAQQSFATDLINSNRKWFRYEWVWEKTKALGFLNAKRMPLRCHENVLVFYKHLPVYNPQFTVGKPYVSKSDGKDKKTSLYRKYGKAYEMINPGHRYPRDVVRFASNSKEMLHPTQKPIKLAEYLIRTYTDVGDVVLDNTRSENSTSLAGKLWAAMKASRSRRKNAMTASGSRLTRLSSCTIRWTMRFATGAN